MDTSSTIDKIAPAWVKFLSELSNPPKDTDNPFFNSKYASLPSILEMTRPTAAKQGLAISQELTNGDNGHISVTTYVLHTSGQWFRTDSLHLPLEKNSAQGGGSASTYARRYALCALLGIAGDEDDDGNAAEVSAAPPVNVTAKKDAERTPGGATVKAYNFAKRLFSQRGIARQGTKDETEEQATERRDENKLAVCEYLAQHGYPVNTEDPLFSEYNQSTISDIIDGLKAEIKERDDESQA